MVGRDAASRTDPTSIPQIDGLRGIAICLVFLRHSYGFLYGTSVASGLLPAIMMSGHTGVTLFFVLSGFLLSRPFLAEAAGGVRVDRSAYFRRRFFRIMPLYLIAVIVAVVARTNDPVEMLRLAVPYLCFLQLVPGASTPMPMESLVWWSLATEVQFYLLLPLLPLALRSRNGRRVGAMLLLAYTTAYGAFAVGLFQGGPPRTRHLLAHSIFGRAPAFALGIGAAALFERYADRVAEWLQRPVVGIVQRADFTLLAIVGALTTLLLGVAPIDYVVLEGTIPAWHLPEAFFWTALLFILLLSRSALARLMANRVTLTIGLLSYSIFLIHMPALVYGAAFIRRWLPGATVGSGQLRIGTWMGIGLVVMLVSSVTYRTIERPAVTLGARLSKRRSATGAMRDRDPDLSARTRAPSDARGARR